MKGIAFTLLNELVEQKFGMEVWDSLLESTGQDGVFTAAASYPDQAILNLVAALSQHSGIAAEDLVRAFGEFMFTGFAQQYPSFFPDGISARELLKSVDGIIHVEVKKLFPDALLPRFEYEEPSADRLVMIYRSERQLCALAEGLINGAAAWFGEPIQHSQTKCTHRGDDHCRFELTFGGRHDRD
ncbi:MAG: heme NO-binding domain-containing protein [Planctomycetaceae bacterium]